MNTFEDESSFTKLLNTIDELYIYIHRYNNEKTPFASDLIILTIFCVFFVTFLKMALIFLCFFLKWILWDIFVLIIKLFKYKCSILWKECCFNINYFKKVFKKIYTYNFYSYDRDIYGKFWITLIPFSYISFIICNVVFCFFEYFHQQIYDNNYYWTKNIILIVLFFLHLFIEIYISLFYYIKDLKKHIETTFKIYMLACSIVLMLYISSFFVSNKDFFQLLQRIARTIYLLYFLWGYRNSLKEVISYNMNGKSYILLYLLL